MTLVSLLRGLKTKFGYLRTLISWFQNSESFVIIWGILETNTIVYINYQEYISHSMVSIILASMWCEKRKQKA